MSSSEAYATSATGPNVAKHDGYVQATDVYTSAHAGSSDHTPTTETSTSEAKPKGAESAPVAANLSAEEKVGRDEVKVTAKPVTHGVLGYKAPGLVKCVSSMRSCPSMFQWLIRLCFSQLRFKKHYFWLGDEAISTEKLGQFLRSEKPEIAHSAAAWSHQTGKGLLYFSKSEESKTNPVGIIKLVRFSGYAASGIETDRCSTRPMLSTLRRRATKSSHSRSGN